MKRKLNKKRLIIAIILLLLIIGIIATIIYLNVRIVDDNSGFTLKEDLTAEVYTEADITDYIDTIEGDILEKDNIDTETIGTKEVTFIYLNSDNRKRRGTINIEIVDTEEPLVWLSSSYQTPVGTEIDLENTVFCVDNYDNNPTCTVEGDYDIDTPGTYSLTFAAQDSSGNTYEKEFNLIVYEEETEDDEEDEEETEEETEEEVIIPSTNFTDVLNEYKTDNNEIGIDVSRYQGDIDFAKVKAAGATFVMIRVGYQVGVGGEYEIDPYFEQNIENALENDLKVGIYFYSYADSQKEAKNQAKWVIEQIEDYNITLPVVFDFESFSLFNNMELSIYGLNQVANTFIETIENAGYDGVLYGSKTYLLSIWKYHTKSVWLAHYTDETDYTGEYFMWQMCDDGIIDGIDGYVDIDILYY